MLVFFSQWSYFSRFLGMLYQNLATLVSISDLQDESPCCRRHLWGSRERQKVEKSGKTFFFFFRPNRPKLSAGLPDFSWCMVPKPEKYTK
jgi:hypothetical protein